MSPLTRWCCHRPAAMLLSAVWVFFPGQSDGQTPSPASGPLNPNAVCQLMSRGTGTDNAFRSLVVPVNFQSGVPLDNTGDNHGKYPGRATLPWFSSILKEPRLHYDQSQMPQYSPYTIPIDNPIAAFGAEAGGSDLYVGQTYSFGAYAGGMLLGSDTNFPPDYQLELEHKVIRISAYRKADFVPGAVNVAPYTQLEVSLPRWDVPDDAAAWNDFVRAGFTATVQVADLSTTIRMLDDANTLINGQYGQYSTGPWGTNANAPAPYLLTHKASSSDYYYVIEVRGFFLQSSIMMCSVGSASLSTPDYSPLYCLDFDARPPWRASFLGQPHFETEMLPPVYQGKSLQDLVAVKTPVNVPVGLDPADCTGVDASPDLRRHPVLDQLVSDLGGDPLALTNFVLNEIELTDSIALNTQATAYDQSFNGGGINRGALDVYLEGQGSPAEQCELLVYLLRQAGVPAAYLFPSHNGIKMLDSELSRLLHLQLAGAYTAPGSTPAGTPQLVPVNYPWVAAYIGGQWVHLFPWLKDTQVQEGLDLYTYLPDDYNSALKWTRHYLYNDPAILSLGSPTDPPSVLFPKFLAQSLQANHPEVSSDDLGLKVQDRRHYYTNWSDFPVPFSVDGKALTRANLGVDPKMFDTVSVTVSSVANPAKHITTGTMRMADVLHRRLIFRHEKTGTNLHNLIVSLSNYRSDATGTASFGYSDSTWLNKQVLTLPLDSTDDQLRVDIKYLRQREAPQSANDYPTSFLVNFYNQELDDTRLLNKGDSAALCFDVGRVTQRMINQHVQEFLAMEGQLAANPAATVDPDVQQGIPTQLLGMSYYRRSDEAREASELLNKVKTVGAYSRGFSILHAQRVGGLLPNNGDITLIQPALDIFNSEIATVGNETAHPDSGMPGGSGAQNFWSWFILEGSAQEHATIDAFYHQTDAASTVRLLQVAQARATANTALPGIVELFTTNYQAQGQTAYNGTNLQDADPNIWSVVSSTFSIDSQPKGVAWMTPGVVQNDTGSYKGVAALTENLDSGSSSAVISLNQNGGTGEQFKVNLYGSANAQNLRLGLDGDGNPVMGNFTPGQLTLAPSQYTDAGWQQNNGEIKNGDATVNDFDQKFYQKLANDLGYTLTPDVNADRAELDRLARERQGLGESGDTTGWLQWAKDPVNVTTGEFYIDAVDLRLNGQFPLELRRNYLSQSYTNTEFGYCWKANYMPSLQLSLSEDTISAAEPDGSIIVYRRTVGNPNLWVPTVAGNPQLSNLSRGAAGGTHNRFNASIQKLTDPSTGQITYVLHDAGGSLRTFTALSFPGYGLTRARPYLTRWQDDRGNYFVFTYGSQLGAADYGRVRRIQGNDGNYLGFYYDPYGHINEAYTGDGRHVYYDYDDFGDLVAVTLPDGAVTQYDYQHDTTPVNGQALPFSQHLITRETKPEGNIVENTCDTLRRVIEQRACVDSTKPGTPVRNATFTYVPSSVPGTPAAGYTTIADAYNKVTRYDYADGQITRVTDPLNQVVQSDWYLSGDTSPGAYPRSLKRRVDKRGLVTSYQYDGLGNVVSTTTTGDITGDGVADTATATSSYNALNLPTQATDATGHQKRYYYENTSYPYLPTRVEFWAAGSLVSQNVQEYTQTGGGQYSCFGLLQREHIASGSPDEAITEWTYDNQGRKTSQTQYSGTADPNVVLNYNYNLRGEMIQQRDAVGGTLNLSYDGLGRVIGREVRDEGNILVSWNYDYYDGNGMPIWSDGPRYGPEDYVWRKYDAASRSVEVERWRSQARADGQGVEAPAGDAQFAGVFYQYDFFNNLVQTIDARHNVTQADYDAIGQLKARRCYSGDAATGTLVSSETFTYEAGGLIRSSIGVLGGTTNRYYTDAGQLRRQENPDGTVLEWRYGLDGRLQREIYSNASYRNTVYDDVLRTTTHTLYNAGGQVLSTTSEQYDRRGNLIGRTEAEGAAFTQTFDGLNRIKTAAGPAASGSGAQQVATHIYDAAGRLNKVTDALGEETDTSLDVLGRPTLVTVHGAGGATVSSTSYLYSPDHQSVTTVAGTGTTAVRTTTYTDNEGATVLSRHEATSEYTLAAYDAAGNLASRRDELGQTTTYAYDALNHPLLQTLPDGAQTHFVVDAAGDTLQRQMPGGTTWKATYDPAGRELTQELDAPGGTPVTRQYGYSYYASGPYVGKLQTTTAPGGVSHVAAYDDFLRTASVTSTGSLPTQSLLRQYTYDRRSLLLSVAQSSPAGGPNAPPPTQVNRLYDGYGQLYDERVYVGGSIFSHLGQTWDAAGHRATLGRGSLVAAQGIGAGASRSFGHRADGLLTGLGWNGPGGTAQSATYGFLDNGLLDSRNGPWRSWSVAQRDSRERPTVLVNDTALPGWGEPLREVLSWRANSTVDYYDAIRNLGPAAGGNNWTEARPYSYNARDQLVSEGFAPAAGQQAALSYGFDFGASPGDLGRRTSATANGWQSLVATQSDAFGRLSQEGRVVQNATFTAQGSAPLAGRISLSLDGVPVAPASVSFNAATGAWSAPLTLTAGGSTHTLGVTAVADAFALKPGAVGTATSTFTVGTAGGAGSDSLARGYDAAGNVLTRGLGAGAGAGTQTLAWDALDRLASAQARDASNAGYNWQAIYDGLGRRLRTIYTPVTSGGSVQTAQATVTDSWFDPGVEFLEVAVAQNAGARQWLLYGPDLDGRYGSAQGIGGLEASVRESDGAGTGYVLDYYGHAEAHIEGSGGSTTQNWQVNRYSGYGVLPGTGTPPSYVGSTATLAQSVGWHGRRLDPTGFYWLGARHYDPMDGRFLTADPLGHGASADLYAYANGDPVNYLDADGRCVEETGVQFNNTVCRAAMGLGQLGLASSDTFNIGGLLLTDTVFGTNYAGEYRGGSNYYSNYYDHPGSFNYVDARSEVAAGGLSAIFNTGTLGFSGLATGAYQTYQTGNFDSLQDGAFGAVTATSLYQLSLPSGDTPSTTPLAPGSIKYGSLDSLGRPTGVTASITKDMINTGTPANSDITPPGWSGNGTLYNEARGHLLGRQLGGSGDVPENLVTLEQNPANSPVMRGFENQVRSAVEGDEVVNYSSTPIYIGNNLIPRGITLQASGSAGFSLNVTVLNPKGL